MNNSIGLVIVFILACISIGYFVYRLYLKCTKSADYLKVEEHLVDDEFVLGKLSSLRVWQSNKPSKTIIDSYRGSLLVTNKRVIFLSCGSAGLVRAFMDNLYENTIDYDILCNYIDESNRSKEFDATRETNAGSISVDLVSIKSVTKELRKVFNIKQLYALISYVVDGEEKSFCFISENTVSRHRAIEDSVREICILLNLPNKSIQPISNATVD